jgi:AcrR family transcriptional regulator
MTDHPVLETFASRAVRRDGDRELPLGPKAQRTRDTILAAALVRFSKHGYMHTTVADVADEAGVSLGTVYQYFRDRSDLVAALVHASVATLLDQDTTFRWSEGLPGIERVIGNFVSYYATWAAMAGVWEEVSHVDADLGELRRTITRVFTGTVEKELRRARKAGQLDAALDPSMTARALTGMVDRYCYVTYVFDPPEGGPPSPAESAAVLSHLWAAAISL